MTTRYLLDTNIVSALLREPHGPVFERIRAVGEANVCTSVVVSSELRFGAAKRGSSRLIAQLEAVLSALDVLPLEPAVDAVYTETRWRLEQRGTPVGANDLFIAAHALLLDCVLVTDNEREFRRVEGLLVENWLRS